jgi:hypothetical protein
LVISGCFAAFSGDPLMSVDVGMSALAIEGGADWDF